MNIQLKIESKAQDRLFQKTSAPEQIPAVDANQQALTNRAGAQTPRSHVTDESLHQKAIVFSLVMLKASIKHQSLWVLWSETTGTV